MKVLFLYPNDFFGPVMTVYGQIIRNIDRSRFTPYVAVNAEATGLLPIAAGDAIVSRWRFGGGVAEGTRAHRVQASLVLTRTLGALAGYAKRQGIELVHATSTPYAGTLALALSRLVDLPLVLHVHELIGRYSGGLGRHSPTRRRLGRILVAHADEVVAVSEFMAAEVQPLRGRGHGVRVVPNGVNLERFHPNVDGSSVRAEYRVHDGEILALQLGRILSSKRQEDFVYAFAQASQASPSLRGLVVGWEDGRYPGSQADLRRICRRLGLGDRFHIADARPDAAELLAAADIVVAPSLEEAWGLVVSEAMAIGRPVVGARSGATPEMVVDGETGFLVPPCSPPALAEHLAQLAQDADLRQRMGTAGRRRAEARLGEAHVAAGFEDIYADASERRRRSRAAR